MGMRFDYFQKCATGNVKVYAVYFMIKFMIFLTILGLIMA